MSSAPFLVARDLVKIYGTRVVLDGVNLTASPGQRIGLVGENGAGKSTLLRLLAGPDFGGDTPDAGEIVRPADLGLLHQELPFNPGQTVGDVLAEALAESRMILTALQETADRAADDPQALAAYGDVLTRAEEIDAWNAERRVEEILQGLGLGAIGWDRRLDELSGGQRTRVALAALLASRPRALLLDEPTNHLDDEAVGFVEAQLRSLPGVVVVASHDRVFLDEVCTDIVDLDPAQHMTGRRGPTRYRGRFSDYLKAKRAERMRWEQAFLAQQDEINALRHAVKVTARQVGHSNRAPRDNDKFIGFAKARAVEAVVARRVRNAQQRLTILERDQIRRPPAPLEFRAPAVTAPTATAPAVTAPTATASAATSPALIAASGAGLETAVTLRDVRLPGRLSLDRLDVPASGRLLVTGVNGSGKSTLLQVIAGRLEPAEGVVLRRRGLRIGLLTQDDHWPDLDVTPRRLYDDVGTAAVPLVDLGLVAPRDLDRPIGALSVGQRRRVALALLFARPPHVLLLDEPTNHVSLALADELEQALARTPGAVVIASHDRWLRRRWDGPALNLFL